MPGPTTRVISAEAKGAYAAMGALATSGVGADRAYRMLRDQGYTIVREDVRTSFRAIRQTHVNRPALTRLNPNNPVPAKLVVEDPRLKTGMYIHTVSAEVRDKVTGYSGQQYISVKSPTLLSRNQVEQYVRQANLERGDAENDHYDNEILFMSLYDVTIGPEL